MYRRFNEAADPSCYDAVGCAYGPGARLHLLKAEHSFSFEHAVASEETVEILGKTFPRYTIVLPEGRVLYDATGGGLRAGVRMGQVLAGFLP